jgi:hypothetical protein
MISAFLAFPLVVFGSISVANNTVGFPMFWFSQPIVTIISLLLYQTNMGKVIFDINNRSVIPNSNGVITGIPP